MTEISDQIFKEYFQNYCNQTFATLNLRSLGIFAVLLKYIIQLTCIPCLLKTHKNKICFIFWINQASRASILKCSNIQIQSYYIYNNVSLVRSVVFGQKLFSLSRRFKPFNLKRQNVYVHYEIHDEEIKNDKLHNIFIK